MMHHVVEQQEYALGQLHHQYRHHGPERPGDEISLDGMTVSRYTWPQSPVSRRGGWGGEVWEDQAASSHAHAGPSLSHDELEDQPISPTKNRQPTTRPREASLTIPGSKNAPSLTIPDPREKEGRPRRLSDLGSNPKPSGLGDLLLRAERRGNILVKLSVKAHATEKAVGLGTAQRLMLTPADLTSSRYEATTSQRSRGTIYETNRSAG